MNKNNRDKSELRLSLGGIIYIVNSSGWITLLVGWTVALMAIITWHYTVPVSIVRDMHKMLRNRTLFCSLCTISNGLFADQTVSVPGSVFNDDMLNRFAGY